MVRGCAFVPGPGGSHRRDVSRGGSPSGLKSREETEGDGPGQRWVWVEQTNGEVQARGNGSLDQGGLAEQQPW